MRLRGAIVLVGVLVVAACGGSEVSTSNEPATDTSDEGEVIRSAGRDDEEPPWAEEGGERFPMPRRPPVRVINGCQIEAYTQCVGADLSGADLTQPGGAPLFLENSDFSGADFSNANLSNVDFGGSNLSGAKFTGANLTYTNFWEANLTGADLSGARINCTTMPDNRINWGAGDC